MARYQAALPRLAQLVDVGSLYNQSFDFERLLTTRPDLLIPAKWQLDGFANYLPVLQQLNIPYIVVDFNRVRKSNSPAFGPWVRRWATPSVQNGWPASIGRALKILSGVFARRSCRHRPLISNSATRPGEYSSSYGASVWGRCYSWPAPAISPPASSLAPRLYAPTMY